MNFISRSLSVNKIKMLASAISPVDRNFHLWARLNASKLKILQESLFMGNYCACVSVEVDGTTTGTVNVTALLLTSSNVAVIMELPAATGVAKPVNSRSEERRVGKECRSRW